MQGFPLVFSLITPINIRINPLIDSKQDGVRVRQYNFHLWNRSCLQFSDERYNSDQWKGKTQHNHSVNSKATRNGHGGLNSMFWGNMFGGTFIINVVKQSLKILISSKKHRRITYGYDSQ